MALFICASAALYLVGNGSDALWDRDEPRYAQTSRQMLQSGDWVVPHYLDLVRTAKPVFIYWCQATAMKVFGDTSFAARFPSSVATVLLLCILATVLWRQVGPERAAFTVFVLASSTLIIVEAKFCITDAVLLLWVTIAQLCLYALWRGSRSWWVVLAMAVAVGLAGLTKGPIVLGFLAATLGVLGIVRLLDRRFPPPLGPLPPPVQGSRSSGRAVAQCGVAVLIVVAIMLPWMLMVYHRDADFFHKQVGHDFLERMVTPLEQHSGPPGYYLITLFATFFPWTLFLPMAIGLGWRHRDDPGCRFALAAIIGPWVMLECVRTKLPHYALPIYPPLAFLVSDAIVRCLQHEHEDARSRAFVIAAGVWAVVVTVAVWVPWLVLGKYHVDVPYAAMLTMGVLGAAVAGTVFAMFYRRRIVGGVLAMGLGTMAVYAVAYAAYLPHAEYLQVSPRVAAVLKANGVTQPHQVIMLDYMEPSLAFYQGGTIREAGPVGFTPGFIPKFTDWMVVTRELWDAAVPGVRDRFDVVSDTYGLAYADKGRWVHVMVLHQKPPG